MLDELGRLLGGSQRKVKSFARKGEEGTGNRDGRAVRGASWNNEPRNARASNRNRNDAANRNTNNGFRCAQ
jgi:formylglycine-generating enzyme required for sulfatase activity